MYKYITIYDGHTLTVHTIQLGQARPPATAVALHNKFSFLLKVQRNPARIKIKIAIKINQISNSIILFPIYIVEHLHTAQSHTWTTSNHRRIDTQRAIEKDRRRRRRKRRGLRYPSVGACNKIIIVNNVCSVVHWKMLEQEEDDMLIMHVANTHTHTHWASNSRRIADETIPNLLNQKCVPHIVISAVSHFRSPCFEMNASGKELPVRCCIRGHWCGVSARAHVYVCVQRIISIPAGHLSMKRNSIVNKLELHIHNSCGSFRNHGNIRVPFYI